MLGMIIVVRQVSSGSGSLRVIVKLKEAKKEDIEEMNYCRDCEDKLYSACCCRSIC